MRVLQVTAIPITARRFVVPLARSLAAAGFEVELATGPGRGLASLHSEGFRVHTLPLSRAVLSWRNLHALGALRALVHAGAFDVVHAHTPAAAAVTRAALRRAPARVLYTMHGSLWGEGVSLAGRTLFTLVERALARWTELVFTVNAEDAADCVRRLGLPAARVRALPAGGAGVAPEFCLDAPAAGRLRGQARGQLGVGADEPLVAYLGRTAAAKGMAVLARAFARLAVHEPGARLLVVGGALEGERGAYSRQRFLREVGRVGAPRVLWLAFQEEVAPFLAAADVVVSPSRREGFGMTLAEAAALGRPVVATATRGAKAVVEPEVTGLLVPLEDAEALAAAILRVLRDGELARRLGVAACRRARDLFARERVIAAYLEAYAELRRKMKGTC